MADRQQRTSSPDARRRSSPSRGEETFPSQPPSQGAAAAGFGATRSMGALPPTSANPSNLGPLSPSAGSSGASFVFPVRSMFQNMASQQQQGQQAQIGAGPSGMTPTRRTASSNMIGTGANLSRVTSNQSSTGNNAGRASRSHSLASQAADAQDSISQMFDGAFKNDEQPAPSPSAERPKLSPITDVSTSSGSRSAPLPKQPEAKEYFPDTAAQQDGAASGSGAPTRRNSVGSPPVTDTPEVGNGMRERKDVPTESERHAHGQIDPVDEDSPAPPATTERAEDNKGYRFSHHPGGDDDAEGGAETTSPPLQAPRPHQATSSDAMDDLVGDGAEGKRGSTRQKIHQERTNNEPDVGPAVDTERAGSAGRDSGSGSGSGKGSGSKEGLNSDFTDIVRLGSAGVSGSEEINSGSGGDSGSGGSRPPQGGMSRKALEQSRKAVVDHRQSVQNFVTKQSRETEHIDPNAPTPVPGPPSLITSSENDDSTDEALDTSASDMDTGPDGDEDDEVTPEDGEEAAARRYSNNDSGSQVSFPTTQGEEPVMTVRFEHVTTDDGHHVVTGREGKLEKCEDEPITTPGSVQGFGVLMVLEEDDDTDDLVVRQVSENCTELLGLSPRYLFRLQCFTHILPRSQDDALRDNIDYLPDPDVNETDTNDEGPQVFLLSGYGEPGSYDGDEPPTQETANKRREWTCWVAAHRPSQKLWDRKDARGKPIPPPNLVVLEFELERDVYNPLYPMDPVLASEPSGSQSPASGSATTVGSGSRGRTDSQDSVSTEDSTASNSTMGNPKVQQPTSSDGNSSSQQTLQTIEEHAIAERVAVHKRGLQGLEGEEMEVDPADILESTTSHAKPLRALERMRRMTRSAATQSGRNITEEAAKGGAFGGGRGPGRRQARRDGAGAGGVGTMDVFAVLAQINDQLGAAPDIETFLKVVVGVIKDLTQFHRCLVYSFDSQWNGQVVAELVDWSKTHDLYKGLMFPMTDIPAQARELYRINKVRLLYDRAQTTARMVMRSKSDLDYPLDMTHSYLRAMSPIHLVYLKNMGVRSSMSISIMAFGSLWGLIACHGYGHSGMRVSFPVRQMLRLLSDSISRNIERLSYAARLHTRKLISTIPTDAHPTGYIVSNADDLIQLFDADSGVLVIGDGAKILGPSSEHGQEILLIAEFLRLKRYENMQISHNINEDFPELRSPKVADVISGLLYVPLSARGNDFIAFLRKGQLREVHWAGKPYKDGKEKGANLEPRQSFKTWSETIAGRSRAWTDEQLETAGVLALVYGKFIEVWRQKESAMRTNQMTSILLTNASHEVRTPLNHIINYLELALDGQLDKETRENLSRSHLASKSLLFTINDLLDLTRIESGNETAFNDPFDLRSCIQDATRVYASEAKRRNLDFEVDLENAPETMVLGDLRKIRTVVANLVANAVKYTSEGRIQVSCRGREPTESGRSSQDSGMLDVEIIVSDTGRGIASDKLEAMFVTFEQAETAPQQSNTTGLGLGLAVVARIVEQLGGQLRAESEVGVGTRFYFTLLMAKYTLEATDSTNSTSSPSLKHIVGPSDTRVMRSNSIGSDGVRSAITRTSAGSSEIDTFVEAFSASHMRGSPDDERIAQAEARMNQPGTFPVTDSSWPIKPQRPDTDTGPAPKADNRSPQAIQRTPSSSAQHRGITPARRSSKDKHAERDSPDKVKTKRTKSTEPLRILVVEDDDVNRRILERRLRLDGHNVLSDVNGQEAVDRIKQDRAFDCILMDIQMPVMDGRQAAAAIRKFEETLGDNESAESRHKRVNNRIPIVAVSASLAQEQRGELAVNFDGWMLKPIDFKRMLQILAGLSDAARRQDDAFVPGHWERGGWLAVEQK